MIFLEHVLALITNKTFEKGKTPEKIFVFTKHDFSLQELIFHTGKMGILLITQPINPDK